MYESRYEIERQAVSLGKTWQAVMDRERELRALLDRPGDIVFIACGSSYWLSLSAHMTWACALKRRTCAITAGDMLLCPEDYRERFIDPILILPSRSGSTSEQLRAVALLRQEYPAAPILSIVEYPDSELAKQSDLSIHIPWANEISVCQTRSFSNLYLALVAIASLYDPPLRLGMEAYLLRRAEIEERDFARAGEMVNTFDFTTVTSLGCGRQYGVTVEGSYICVEMAQMICSYYGLLEYRHGPIVTCNPETLLAVCSNAASLPFEEKMAAEATAAGARVLAVVAQEGFENAFARFSLEGAYPREAVALHFVFVLQAIAHFKAIRKGLDPDRPGDLVPFIKL